MMNLILPVMMIFAFSNFPSAFILYWLVFNVFSIVHQALFNKLYQPQPLVIAQEKRRNTAHASNRANS
jgi:membrane protein insertase Oxa1/YidC/SpoIIIJ